MGEINTLAGVATPVAAGEESESSEEEDEVDASVEEENKGDADSSSESEEEEEEKPKTGKAVKKVISATKLKKDLEEEQRELGKMLMTKRQRKLYQDAEKEKSKVKAESKLLRQKKKAISKFPHGTISLSIINFFQTLRMVPHYSNNST